MAANNIIENHDRLSIGRINYRDEYNNPSYCLLTSDAFKYIDIRFYRVSCIVQWTFRQTMLHLTW